jgi:hypothetical protein
MSQNYIGYHGTDKPSASNIIDTNRFWMSNDEDEYLGKGIYFFWDPDDSHWWCTNYKNLQCYIILQVDIKASNIVDLVHIRRDQELFSKLCNKVKNKSPKKSNGELRSNYMSLAMKLMVREINPDIIIGGFDRNRKFWFTNYDDKQKFPMVPLQVQLCVLNHACIGPVCVYQEVG